MAINIKDRRIFVRVTDTEYSDLKKKAENYPTLSSFVLDACMNFDDALGIKRLDIIRNWSDDYSKFESELHKIGSNINQLAHQVNKLSSIGVVSPDLFLELQKQYGNLIDLLSQITKSNMHCKNVANDFMHIK